MDSDLEKVVNKIFEDNIEYLNKIGIRTKEEALEKCMKLPDYLEKIRPKKYGKSSKNYEKYHKNLNLNEVIVFLGEMDGKEVASLFGTEKSNFKGHMADEIKKENGEYEIKIDSNFYEKINESLKLKNALSPEELNDILTIDEITSLTINNKSDKIREKIISKTNKKNGTEDYTEEKDESEINKKDSSVQLSAGQIEMCRKYGISKNDVKNIIHVRAGSLLGKTEGNSMEENQIDVNKGDITLLQVRNEKVTKNDRYYGFQDEKMVLYGYENTNEDLGRIFDETGKTNYENKTIENTSNEIQNGKIERISVENEDGKKIYLFINDNPELCIHEIEKYRDAMQKLMEDYEEEIRNVDDDNEKDKITDDYKKRSDEIAKYYDISIDNNDKTFDIIKEDVEQDVVENDDVEQEYDSRDPAYRHNSGFGPKIK